VRQDVVQSVESVYCAYDAPREKWSCSSRARGQRQHFVVFASDDPASRLVGLASGSTPAMDPPSHVLQRALQLFLLANDVASDSAL
jgi:hypothetical protein